MTVNELSQLYWLNKEIDRQKIRLEKLQAQAEKTTSYITGMPMGGNTLKDDVYAEIADLSALISLNIKKSIIEHRRLERFLSTINDSEMREIFRLRYINCLSWEMICEETGQGGDGSTQRKKHNRYLKKVS